MRVTLKEFQADYVSELYDTFHLTQDLATKTPAAVLLNAPTGSGKTLMVTSLIDGLLEGTDTDDGDSELVFVWLTDQPELNKQTYDKMLATSSVLTADHLTIIDAGLDAEHLDPGKVYFLNTQKLSSGTSFVKNGNERTFTVWETLQNTIAASPTKFVLIVDEAHRGTKGRDAIEAETIVQKFLKGSPGEIGSVPLVVGISATPDRFVQLCNDTARPVLRVDVDPDRVRESGLLKEYVDLYHPDEPQPSHATMLIQAAGAWKRYRTDWLGYGEAEAEVVPSPVLLVQVEDARKGSPSVSVTDLPMVVGTLAKELGVDSDDDWLAHAFQDNVDITVAGQLVRYLAPSAIDADPHVQVVLFKTSLNTGWDCPRAEVMVSFRPARDETNIAQLVGRMVRAPLARRIDANEHLNTVALYLPYFDRQTVEKVVARLTSDAANVPPTKAREGRDAITLTRAADKATCFAILQTLPSYTIPRIRPMKPVSRVAKLASLLAETGLEPDPVKNYRAELIQILLGLRERLADDEAFKNLMDEASVLAIRRRRVDYAVAPQSVAPAAPVTGSNSNVRAPIAAQNIDDLYADAGRVLGEGLHKEYLRARVSAGVVAQLAKLELHALVVTDGVVAEVNDTADNRRKAWIAAHKATIKTLDEKYRQTLREIEGAGADPEETTIDPPPSIEWTKGQRAWPAHLYTDAEGNFLEDFSKSSWERRVVEIELARKDIVGWLRNPDRKPWSLRIPRREGMKWVPFYPDFIFFRQTPGGILADIVDPHLLSDVNAPERAAALAMYARNHFDHYGRIELVIFDGDKDVQGRRLNLLDEQVREDVAGVTTPAQLKRLFEKL